MSESMHKHALVSGMHFVTDIAQRQGINVNENDRKFALKKGIYFPCRLVT